MTSSIETIFLYLLFIVNMFVSVILFFMGMVPEGLAFQGYIAFTLFKILISVFLTITIILTFIMLDKANEQISKKVHFKTISVLNNNIFEKDFTAISKSSNEIHIISNSNNKLFLKIKHGCFVNSDRFSKEVLNRVNGHMKSNSSTMLDVVNLVSNKDIEFELDHSVDLMMLICEELDETLDISCIEPKEYWNLFDLVFNNLKKTIIMKYEEYKKNLILNKDDVEELHQTDFPEFYAQYDSNLYKICNYKLIYCERLNNVEYISKLNKTLILSLLCNIYKNDLIKIIHDFRLEIIN